jgi:leucine dehydrogenase
MSPYFQSIEKREHEHLSFFYCSKTGLRFLVAIHSSVLGPALGGCRIREYVDEAAAVEDVLRLSEGMTYKNSLAGLDLGGGKACVWKGPKGFSDRPAIFRKIGECVESLGGRYITAEDMGTSVEDMRHAREQTKHVAGFPIEDGGSGDPSPWTALGVFHAIRAACERRFGSVDLRGRSVSIQGVGHVGSFLASHLHRAGAKLFISDPSEENLRRVAQETGASVVSLDALYDLECDVYSPCALGQTVNKDTLIRLRCAIIAGAANNQLFDASLYSPLAEKKILYCPDFAINSGGVISCASEFIESVSRASWLQKKVDSIYDTCHTVLRIADERKLPTETVAVELAKDRIRLASIVD